MRAAVAHQMQSCCLDCLHGWPIVGPWSLSTPTAVVQKVSFNAKELVAHAILAAGFCGSKDWWHIEQSSCAVSSAATWIQLTLAQSVFSAGRLRSLMAALGLYYRWVGALEGSDDPGKVFIKGCNVRWSFRDAMEWTLQMVMGTCHFHCDASSCNYRCQANFCTLWWVPQWGWVGHCRRWELSRDLSVVETWRVQCWMLQSVQWRLVRNLLQRLVQFPDLLQLQMRMAMQWH